jgi:hypothetical protein
MAMSSQDNQSGWAEVPGWTINSNLDDLLHCSHQGLALHSIASVVIHALTDYFPNMTLAALDEKLRCYTYAHYRRWSKKNKQKYSSSKFTGLRFGRGETHKSYPELGSVYKAAQVKIMISWAAAFALEHTGDSAEGNLRACCAYYLAEFEHRIDCAGEWMDWEERKAVYDMGHLFLLSYQKLAHLALLSKKTLYKVQPKFHQFDHLITRILRTGRNPRPPCLI